MKLLARCTFLALAATGLALIGTPAQATTAVPPPLWGAHFLDVMQVKVTVMEDGRAVATQQLQIHLNSQDTSSASDTETQTYESGWTDVVVPAPTLSRDGISAESTSTEHGRCPAEGRTSDAVDQTKPAQCTNGQGSTAPGVLKHEATFSQVDSGFKVSIRPFGESRGSAVVHAKFDLTQLAAIETKTDSDHNVHQEPRLEAHQWEGDLALAVGASTTVSVFHQPANKVFGFRKSDHDVSVVFERLN